MKTAVRFVLVTITLLVGWVLLGLWRIPPGWERRDDPRLVAHLRHLDAEVDRAEPERMQRLFPEGYVFTRVLHGLAWVSLATDSTLDASLRAEAHARARQAQADLNTPFARSRFQPGLDPPYGAFYAGWTLRLRFDLLRASPGDTTALAAFRRDADRLAAALSRSLDSTGSPFLPSYRRGTWPADGLVGVSALALHDRHYPPRYTAVLARWREAMRAKVDPATGILPYSATTPGGDPLVGARGSSSALLLRFMADVDPEAGRVMYARFREHLVTTRLGLAVVQEFPDGVDGSPDVDSGPTPWGVSLPGSVVTIGTARRYGDLDLAEQLSQTVEAFGVPLTWRNRRFYAFGAMPVGDVFLVWSRTAPASSTASGFESKGSRWPLSVALVAFLALAWWTVVRSTRRAVRPRREEPVS